MAVGLDIARGVLALKHVLAVPRPAAEHAPILPRLVTALLAQAAVVRLSLATHMRVQVSIINHSEGF